MDAPQWLMALFAAMVGATIVVSWRAYFRLLRTNPDALRSGELRALDAARDDALVRGTAEEASLARPGPPPELPRSSD